MPGGSVIDQLTPREKQILTLIGEGYSLPEIAQHLHRSIKTIETHRLTLGRKLSASNRVELARIAIKTGLVKLENNDDQASGLHAPDGSNPDADDAYTLRLLRKIESKIGVATGANYLRRLSCALTEVLEFEYCGVCDLMEIDGKLKARSLFNSNSGVVSDIFTYTIQGSPCSDTVTHGRNICLLDAAEKYPNDTTLVEIGAQSYIGFRLDSEQGRPLGVLWLICTKPIERADIYLNLLRLIACRCASELTRSIDSLQELENEEARVKLREELGLHELQVSRSNARLDCLMHVYHKFSQVMPTGLIAFDTEKIVRYANQAAGKLFGYSKEQLVGKEMPSLIAPESMENYRQEYNNACEVGEVLDLRLDGVRKDGHSFPLRIACSGLFDHDGKVNGTVVLLAEDPAGDED